MAPPKPDYSAFTTNAAEAQLLADAAFAASLNDEHDPFAAQIESDADMARRLAEEDGSLAFYGYGHDSGWNSGAPPSIGLPRGPSNAAVKSGSSSSGAGKVSGRSKGKVAALPPRPAPKHTQSNYGAPPATRIATSHSSSTETSASKSVSSSGLKSENRTLGSARPTTPARGPAAGTAAAARQPQRSSSSASTAPKPRISSSSTTTSKSGPARAPMANTSSAPKPLQARSSSSVPIPQPAPKPAQEPPNPPVPGPTQHRAPPPPTPTYITSTLPLGLRKPGAKDPTVKAKAKAQDVPEGITGDTPCGCPVSPEQREQNRLNVVAAYAMRGQGGMPDGGLRRLFTGFWPKVPGRPWAFDGVSDP